MVFLRIFKMVVKGILSPDPSNRPEEQLIPSDVGVIVTSSSDSEDDGISYEGYEVLPQEFVETNTVGMDDIGSDDDSSDDEDDFNITIRDLPSFDASTDIELTDLWNSSFTARQLDIIIDQSKEEEIRSAMAGFRLPSTSIPSWAANVPEEEWKEQLKNRIALLNKLPSV